MNLSMRKKARSDMEQGLVDLYSYYYSNGSLEGYKFENVIDSLITTIEYELSSLGINSFDDFVDAWEYENDSIEKFIGDAVGYSPAYESKRQAGLVLLHDMYKRLREQNFKEYYALQDLVEELDNAEYDNVIPTLDRVLDELSQAEEFNYLDIQSIKEEPLELLEEN